MFRVFRRRVGKVPTSMKETVGSFGGIYIPDLHEYLMNFLAKNRYVPYGCGKIAKKLLANCRNLAGNCTIRMIRTSASLVVRTYAHLM